MRAVVRTASAGCRRSIPVLCALLLASNASAGSCSGRIQRLQARVNALLAREASAGLHGPEGTFAALGPGAGAAAPARSESPTDGQGRSSRILIHLHEATRAQADGDARACRSALRHARWAFTKTPSSAARAGPGSPPVLSR